MRKHFGSPAEGVVAPSLRTTEQVDRAIYELLWYRESIDLEFSVQFDMWWIRPEEYAMCSKSTQELARIFTQDYMTQFCCDSRAINEPPMIRSIQEWIEETYGGQE